MAALEYEVRDEYKDYTVTQLLDSPVTCFQGVGDIQSEILQRYFNVATVKDLANMPQFVQALTIQEAVLQGGDRLGRPISEIAQGGEDFHVRGADQAKALSELPDAPVHVLEGLTPGQDLALYDAFRITNLTHLAHNRIMLEARVIEYLAQQGGEDAAAGDAPQQDAISSILGSRAATAAAGQARAQAGGFGDTRMHDLAGEVTTHVRDRVEAMRDRTHDRAAAQPDTGARAGTGMSRLDAIRQSREAGQAGGRQGDPAQSGAGGARSRADDILASRSGTVAGAVGADSVSARRGAEGGGSRTDALSAARQIAGRGGPPPTAPSRGAPARGGTATATATPRGKGAAAAAAAEEATLPTEEEAAAAAATEAAAREQRQRRAAPNPAPFIAAAVIVLLLLAGLVWFLVSRSGPEQTAMEQAATTTQEQGAAAPGDESAAGTGTDSQAAGATGTDTTAAVTPPPPPRIKGTHVVVRGDTLWFISEKEYANPLNWPTIFLENQDQIANPDLIYPDQEFRIPTEAQYRFPSYPEGYQRTR